MDEEVVGDYLPVLPDFAALGVEFQNARVGSLEQEEVLPDDTQA